MRQQTYRAVILLGLGLAVRAALIQAYPQIFGSDSITRLVNRHLIVVAHQLPALQASIWLLTKLSGDPLLIRYWMAGIGAVAGLGFYLLATDLMERDDAFCAALFFVSNPLVLAYSIVPYQEIVMLAGLFFAFHFFFAERYVAASVCLGLACLTRYEAWAAAPVLALVYGMRQRGLRPLGLLLFGWAPLVWVLHNRGLGPSGTFVADVGLTPARLMRYVYLGWITLKNTPIPVLWLAGLGLWKVRSRRLALLGAFLGLFLLGILFSAHGDPRDRERFVSAREAHLTVAAVLLLAGVGLGRLPQWRVPLAAAGVALGLFGANRFVAQATAEPEVDLSYRAARYLDRVVAEGERVLVMAQPVPREAFEAHLRRAFLQGGETARQDAQRVLERIDSSPPAYQRMLVHSRLGRERLRASGAGAQWIVVWSDLEPVPVMTQPPVETLRSGNLMVRIYRMR